MGFYDTIKCEYPLPDPEVQDHDFQTNTFCHTGMDEYRITKYGRLICEYKEEWHGMGGGCEVDTNMDGRLHMMTLLFNPPETRIIGGIETEITPRIPYTYHVYFKDGTVTEIVRLDGEKDAYR